VSCYGWGCSVYKHKSRRWMECPVYKHKSCRWMGYPVYMVYRPPYPWYIDPLPMVYRILPMTYRPPYPWYFDTNLTV
jgi:hypothetical protein